MKFNVEVISPVKKILHIEMPREDIKKAFDDAYNKINKTAKIKGFRPGKTPRSILERLYKKDVHKDVSSQMIQNGLSEALRKSKFKFVGSKKIEPPKLDESKSYFFDAEIEVKPEIDLIDFKGLKLERNIYKASNEEVEAQLHMLQKNLAKKEPIEDRGIKKHDIVLLDYEGFKEGIHFEAAGKKNNFTVKVGSSPIGTEFDEKIIGMKKNEEKEILVKFPNNYHNDELANLEIMFIVKIIDINIEILPTINDDMAKQFGPFKSLDDLKDKILENLKQGYEKRTEQELNEQIFTNLINKTEFELPESMVRYELDSIIEEAEKSFNYHNKSLKDAGLTRKALEEKYEEIAKKQVRRQLILSKIIEQENINISNKDLEKDLENAASIYNTSLETIKTFYAKNQDKLEAFKYAMLEKRAIDTIIKESNITDIEAKLTPNI